MTLAQLDKKLDDIRAEATRTWQEHKREAEFIQNNRDLTDVAKKEHTDRSLTVTREALKKLEQSEYAEIESSKRAAERAINATAGSSSHDIISFRDAQDRAERITDHSEARRIMDRALASADTVLATAVMRQAVSQGWEDVYQAFTAEHPQIASHVELIAQLQRYEASMHPMLDRSIYWIAGS